MSDSTPTPSPNPITLSDCLEEVENALNYWYPLASSDDRERHARHVRLFEFRDRLRNQISNPKQEEQKI